MHSPFFSTTSFEPADDALVRILARVRVLAAEEGGRTAPFTAGYRPNHNFGGPENRQFFMGQIEVPEGEWITPGDCRDLVVTFVNVIGLAEHLQVGRQWRIQEGGKLVANAEILSILPSDKSKFAVQKP